MKIVSVLFARADSVYKQIAECDVWDKERNAMLYDENFPIVAHPPCRAWGRLRIFAKPEAGERNTARLAVALIRKNGGVLEHPQGSTLWPDQGLPPPGEVDQFGGWTLLVWQSWWGHRATKKTWLYIVGCKPDQIPDLPQVRKAGTHVVKRDRFGMKDKKHLTKAERESTPGDFAEWLVRLALRCKGS